MDDRKHDIFLQNFGTPSPGRNNFIHVVQRIKSVAKIYFLSIIGQRKIENGICFIEKKTKLSQISPGNTEQYKQIAQYFSNLSGNDDDKINDPAVELYLLPIPALLPSHFSFGNLAFNIGMSVSFHAPVDFRLGAPEERVTMQSGIFGGEGYVALVISCNSCIAPVICPVPTSVIGFDLRLPVNPESPSSFLVLEAAIPAFEGKWFGLSIHPSEKHTVTLEAGINWNKEHLGSEPDQEQENN